MVDAGIRGTSVALVDATVRVDPLLGRRSILLLSWPGRVWDNPARSSSGSRDTGEHVVSDSEDVQEASKEWADPVAARTGPFGAASDIPCEVWGDEFDSVNAAKTIRLIGRFRSCRSPAIPGVKPA